MAISPEQRKLKKHLTDLTSAVAQYIALLDQVMKERESAERGKRIAHLSNQLEMANDTARYFGLGIDYRTDRKGKS